MGVRNVDRQSLQFPLFEKTNQATGEQVVVDDVSGLHQDSQVMLRCGPQHLAVVGFKDAAHVNCRDEGAAGETPLMGKVGQLVDQQSMPGQLVGRTRRAESLEIRGRGRKHPLRLRQAPHGDPGLAFELAIANGHVDATLE